MLLQDRVQSFLIVWTHETGILPQTNVFFTKNRDLGTTSGIQRRLSHPFHLSARHSGDENHDDETEDENEDDEFIDEHELGDWRSFRNTLANSGLTFGEQRPSKENSGSYYTESDIDGFAEIVQLESPLDSAAKYEDQQRPKSVSKSNEQLLISQNKQLASEYLMGVWAHETANVSFNHRVLRRVL